ncbi:D-glucuronyl C5-epimerase family protein, partial [Salinivibrio sp. AR640]|uniref:D-glucuronyl C5-epimerase family protein n=1 Tax=Salinivibrio sp. AR640 TaxID=1909437 RepID=UPI000986EAE1
NSYVGENKMYYLKMFRRWFLMFIGKSQFHMEQGVGAELSPLSLRGYPSDLTEKTNWQGYVDDEGIIKNRLTSGDLIYFPIAIAQKALGHHDLYLKNKNKNKNKKDKDDFLGYCNFLISLMDENGLVETWHKQDRDVINNYSSMTQGQIVSCFCRAFKLTKVEAYLEAARLASRCLFEESEYKITIKFDYGFAYSEMPNNNGSVILNGWIFTLWGLYDLQYVDPSNELSELIAKNLDTLINSLHFYDNGYWSMYDNEKIICSPFYHRLHINQLKALYVMTGRNELKETATKWERYERNIFFKAIAIIVKAKQKLVSRKYNEFI